MGTRNLTKVIDDNGLLKVAQYGQWDGYPDGQGITALGILRQFRNQIEARLPYVRFGTEQEILTLLQQGGDCEYTALTRDTCAWILGCVALGNGELVLADESEFESDSLMCEGVYTVDYRTREFISHFGERKVTFKLGDLPDDETYLSAWKSETPFGDTPTMSVQPWNRGESETASDTLTPTNINGIEVNPNSDLATILAKYKCPSCDGFIPNNQQIGAYSGAISRKDNTTEICSSCGTLEAINDWVKAGE
jgi:hypothetical protein